MIRCLVAVIILGGCVAPDLDTPEPDAPAALGRAEPGLEPREVPRPVRSLDPQTVFLPPEVVVPRLSVDVGFANFQADAADAIAAPATTFSGSSPGWTIGSAMVTQGTHSGEYMLAGSEPGTGGLDLWLERRSATGTLIWRRTVAGAGGYDDYAHAVACTHSGDAIYFGAGVSMPPGGTRDAWLRKYDAAGNTLWTVTVDGNSHDNDELNAIAIDEPRGALIVGGVLRNPGAWNDAWGARYTTDGSQVWSFTFNDKASQEDGIQSAAVDPTTGNAAFGGYSMPTADPTYSHWLAWARLMSPAGQIIWSDNFARSNGGTSLVRSIAWDQGIVLAAISYNDPSEHGGSVVRYTVQSNSIDQWKLAEQTPRAVAIGPNATMYVAGDRIVSNPRTFFLGRLSNNGSFAWSAQSQPQGQAYGIAVNSNRLVGAGLMVSANTDFPYHVNVSPLP